MNQSQEFVFLFQKCAGFEHITLVFFYAKINWTTC